MSRYSVRLPHWPDPSKVAVQGKAVVGFSFLSSAPALGVLRGCPPKSASVNGCHTYLWVIDLRGVLYILDRGLVELSGACPKHTNLTGGMGAYVGGEMWFKTDSSLWLSGKSGRYGPLSSAQLDDVASVFMFFGYEVESLGWDDGTDSPKLFLE